MSKKQDQPANEIKEPQFQCNWAAFFMIAFCDTMIMGYKDDFRQMCEDYTDKRFETFMACYHNEQDEKRPFRFIHAHSLCFPRSCRELIVKRYRFFKRTTNTSSAFIDNETYMETCTTCGEFLQTEISPKEYIKTYAELQERIKRLEQESEEEYE